MPRRKRLFPEEVRNRAIDLVVNDRLSVADVAALMGLPLDPIYVWVKRHREKMRMINAQNQLRLRLEMQLMRVERERDIMANLAAKLLADRKQKEVT
jgi:transposase